MILKSVYIIIIIRKIILQNFAQISKKTIFGFDNFYLNNHD